MTSTDRRMGLGEAPENPDPTPRFTIDPQWTPKQFAAALVRANWRRLLAATSLLMVFQVAMMLIPTAVGGFVDNVAAPAFEAGSFASVSGSFALWAGFLIALYVAMNIGFRFGGRVGWLAVQRGQYELSQAVIARVLDPRGFAGPRRPPGKLLAISTGDTERACQTLYITVYPPAEAVALVVAAVVLGVVNPWLGIGTIVGLPILLFLLHLVAAPLQKRSMREQGSLANAAAAAGDLMSGFRVIRGLHAQGTASAKYAVSSREALDATLSARSARARFDGASTAGAQIFAAILSLVAIAMALNGAITAGELVTVTGIAVVIIGPLQSLVGTLGAMWAMSQASVARLLELMSAPFNPAALGTDSPAAGPLSLPDVSIPTGEFLVMDIPQSAAAALADALTLQRESDVALNDVPLTTLDPHQLRSHVAVLPHRPGIFAGTVGSNVNADPAVAEAALEVAAVSELSPDTQVGDGATELSGGQRQRIALARGIAAEPPVLVLLDPTTSVDAVTEALIAERLYERRRGLTTIVITSAPAFRAIADRVIGEDS